MLPPEFATARGGLIVRRYSNPGQDILRPAVITYRRAMFLAKDLLPGLPDDFQVLVAEQRPPLIVRDGVSVQMHDSTL